MKTKDKRKRNEMMIVMMNPIQILAHWTRSCLIHPKFINMKEMVDSFKVNVGSLNI